MTGEDEAYVVEGFAVPEELGALHDLLARAAAEHPECDATDLMLFETAVIEIANNVVEHGKPVGHVRWRLELRIEDDQIAAELLDTGQEFAPDLGATMPGEDAESGRGLPLAEALLDKIELERVNGENHWRMVRRLGHGAP